ncbi:RNA polymerase sigma factor [Raoultibacter phocaeensis]|uniref:RNA polymerase sigma factor n=1 Tax=Raoultibacter phocaeensis TaxID=2479841 RepID=UPI0011194B1D|nr:RNA polymerase sigma factor [Raoultibacter phocaeensis]
MTEYEEGERQARSALARIATGDECALEELYRAYGQAVFAFVVSRMSDREAAEEVAADTWLGCWRSAQAFRGESRVLTWLLGIAKRQVYASTRRKRLPITRFDACAEERIDDAEGPESLALAGAGVEVILGALDALPDELAETVRLAWLHELPYADIAAVTDVPVGTVKSRVSRARRMVQESLEGKL